MKIKSIVDAIRIAPNCKVHPTSGLPTLEPGHVLPDDLREFYTICGGITLFEGATFPLQMVQPHMVVIANPVIVNSVSEEELRANDPHNITWSWYIVATGPNAQYITIDLDPKRLGRCYDSSWDKHAEDSPIIALSFTEFLYKSLFFSNLGEYYYWNPQDGIAFQSIGRANNY